MKKIYSITIIIILIGAMVSFAAAFNISWAASDKSSAPLKISNINVDFMPNMAIITWITNAEGEGTIEYGLSSGVYDDSLAGGSMTVVKNGFLYTIYIPIEEGETYYYKITFVDSEGSIAESKEKTFTKPISHYPNPSWSAQPATPAIPATPPTEKGEGAIPAIPAKPAEPPDPNDKEPPIISDITVSDITDTSATISWHTDEDSDSVVEYGLATGSYDFTALGDTVASSSLFFHTVNLTSLEENTTYHYKVSSTDNNGNKTESEDRTFTTLITPPPFIPSWSIIQVSDALAGIHSVSPAIAWGNSKYGVVWRQSDGGTNEKIIFALLNESGNKIGNDLILDQTSSRSIDLNMPVIAWGDDGYGIAWTKNGNSYYDELCSVYFTKVDASGNKVTDNTIVISGKYGRYGHSGTCPIYHSIVWTGTEYGIVWYENNINLPSPDRPHIYLAKFNKDGTKQGDNIVLLSSVIGLNQPRHPSIVWTGNEYGIAFKWGGAGGSIYFSRFDSDGIEQGEAIKMIETIWYPTLTWTGSEYAIIWVDRISTPIRQIFFTNINRDGVWQENIVQVTNISSDSTPPGGPSIIWTGLEYGLSWSLFPSGTIEDRDLYFGQLNEDGILKDGSQLQIADGGIGSHITWNGLKYGIIYSGKDGVYFAIEP